MPRLHQDVSAGAFFLRKDHATGKKDKDPDPPSRHHLPFDKPFDRLMVLSQIEGLTALRKVEGRRCLRSLLSFDLEALDRLAAYCSIRLSRRSSAPCI